MMPTEHVFLTTASVDTSATPPARPVPGSPGETYLLGLLDTQSGLEAALSALRSRASEAGAEETEFIRIQKGNIQADYLKLDAMVTAYLSKQTVFKVISDTDLQNIRNILDRLQGFTAKREKASAIVGAVTELLNTWTPKPAASAP